MSREIKFRTPFKINLAFSHFQYWGIDYPEKGINTFRGFGTGIMAGKDQQFIGLYDKNGKEIYEGDFVKGQYEFSGKKPKRKHEAVIEVKYSAPHHGIAGFHIWPINFGEFQIEVIGNIYENPELLNSTNQ